jgi:serine/threonine protein kinase
VTTHQFSINRDTVDMNAAFQNLLCKVAMLHDLKIVHRDIKPENILYSPLSKGFVIGDFGMSLLIK